MNEHHKVVGRPFPPGVSGNPGGRPKELRDITELARVGHGLNLPQPKTAQKSPLTVLSPGAMRLFVDPPS